MLRSPDHKLKKLDISGGPAQTLCDAADVAGGGWTRDPNCSTQADRPAAEFLPPDPYIASEAQILMRTVGYPHLLDGEIALSLGQSNKALELLKQSDKENRTGFSQEASRSGLSTVWRLQRSGCLL
jgi:hypothetical protein